MQKAVKKPWGYEFLLFESNTVAIWYLNILPNQQTSLHCHPNKKTGLLVLNGIAEVSLLSDKYTLYTNDKIMLRHGVFHSTLAVPTKNMDSLELLEIETPNNKNDLVRIKDKYNRAGKPYEGEESFFERPKLSKIILDKFKIKKIISYNDIINKSDNTKIIIITGGIFASNHCVCGPGDIVTYKVFKFLSEEFRFTESEIIEI